MKFLFGGIIKANKSRKVLLPVRIILTLLIDLSMIGISVMIVAAGISALGDITSFGIFVIIIGTIVLLAWLRVIAKSFIGKSI